jgi:hypothetical protein
MSSDSHGLGVSDFELRSLADLAVEGSGAMAAQAKWNAEQGDKKAKAQAEQAKLKEEDERRRQQAEQSSRVSWCSW